MRRISLDSGEGSFLLFLLLECNVFPSSLRSDKDDDVSNIVDGVVVVAVAVVVGVMVAFCTRFGLLLCNEEGIRPDDVWIVSVRVRVRVRVEVVVVVVGVAKKQEATATLNNSN